MTDFLVNTVTDIRGGRQSWRVILSMALPSFVIAIVFSMVQV